jgi:ketosteroid isomerase-like protein
MPSKPLACGSRRPLLWTRSGYPLCMESGIPSRDTAWAMSEENLAAIKRGYEALNRGDASAMSALAGNVATGNLEWEVIGSFPGREGLYAGPNAMQAWMDAIRSEWKEFEVSLDEVLHDGEDVVVVAELLRGRRRGSGEKVERRIFSAYWFEEGKLRRRAPFSERTAALEAAGLSE